MLSWTKHKRADGLWSYSARTYLGTALVHEKEDGQATVDMWKPDQRTIGTGVFPNVDAAKTRAETILDPRATVWDMLLDDVLDETG
jgi:hypothetical protein